MGPGRFLRLFHRSSTRGKPNLVFLGGPGVGKGTYANRVCPVFGLEHVSTGDLVRAEIKKQSDVGVHLKQLINKGKLAPDDLIISLLAKELKRITAAGSGFLLDGFPRTLPQALSLAADPSVRVDAVIHLSVDDEVLLAKISGRRMCSGCGANYNVAIVDKAGIYMPPMLPKVHDTCDSCGTTPLMQREDDREEVARHRIELYHQQIDGIIDFYKARNLLTDFAITASTDEMTGSLMGLVDDIASKVAGQVAAESASVWPRAVPVIRQPAVHATATA